MYLTSSSQPDYTKYFFKLDHWAIDGYQHKIRKSQLRSIIYRHRAGLKFPGKRHYGGYFQTNRV